ncbi:hopanoid-associated sugar epimerase [Anaeromyxobacter sp. Fw109-5]|uniref:hopanoid-associated sugar epimerase n=1 Tax=Anaeromyxobacter sp. (strain Fw109-5) TaxID=404589 RepID=UPI0000ED6CAC|nr:hopanoid-associated sugar epimerase [Anaeromyxobacter sp. Fw109-5]ABS28262.1 NAD-dependent epimerase/dehydratase [Anaeromyxobacter sp. Fw109-5]
MTGSLDDSGSAPGASGRVLVTGATGFLGANVARLLLERGVEVRALVRAFSPRTNVDGLPIELVEGDLRDAEAVRRAVRGCRRVFHVAADYRFWARDPRELYASNVEGTVHVMEACLAEGVERVVYTSTVGTIGLAAAPAPCDEHTPLVAGQLTSHYKRSKLEAERAALSYVARGLPVVVVNPSAPVGAWDVKPTPTGRILLDFALGKLPAFVDTGLNVVHARDVAEGHLLAAARGRVGERYILGHRNMTLAEILAEAGAILGRPAPRLRLPYAAALAVGALDTALSRLTHRPPTVALEAVRMSRRRMFFDAGKAVRELGLPQTPVRRAFEDAIAWFAERGYLAGAGQGRTAWASR